MNWKDAKVTISGVDGFIGSQIARELLGRGAQVSGILHYPNEAGKSGLAIWGIENSVKLYAGDIANRDFLESTLTDINPTWIFHLAAQSIVTNAQLDPYRTFETNIKGTYNLLYLASTLLDVQGIIIASSDKAYGKNPILPYTENMSLKGGSAYDTSKACADLISSNYSVQFDLPLCITRCANVYGPGDLHFSRIVPDTIRSVINGTRPIIKGHGLHERDFIYIDDAVSGYLGLAEYLEQNRVKGEAFNFGTGNGIKIIELVKMIIDISNSNIKEATILGRDNIAEIMKQSVDATKAHEYLGWKPRYSLREGLKLSIDWYRDYFFNRSQSEKHL